MDQYIKNEWCIENDFAAQRELAAIEEARGFRETEKLRAQLAASEQRVKALEEALREIRSAAIRGIHGDFLDVNVVVIANKALEVACQK